MISKKLPGSKDIKGAAQAAAETAQAISSGAMRVPPATLAIAAELPDLLENMAAATARLNEAIDRAERFMALADPMIRTMDHLLPQLETLVATSDEVFKTVSSLPGVSTIGRLAGGATQSTRGRPPRKGTQSRSK